MRSALAASHYGAGSKKASSDVTSRTAEHERDGHTIQAMKGAGGSAPTTVPVVSEMSGADKMREKGDKASKAMKKARQQASKKRVNQKQEKQVNQEFHH
jgi:hypothetical protein